MKGTSTLRLPSLQKITACIAALACFSNTIALPALATECSAHSKARKIAEPVVAVNAKTGPHTLRAINSKLSLPADPSDLELSTARIFEEPLVATSGNVVAGENAALASALAAFKAGADSEDFQAFLDFVKQFPNSRWRASIEYNVGLRRFRSGFLSQSIALWTSAWNLSKNETSTDGQALASASLAELAVINARLGRMKDLEDWLALAKGRPIYGATAQKIKTAQEGLGQMKTIPGISFRCGPEAVNMLLFKDKQIPGRNPVIEKAMSTTSGTNLAQVKQLADQVGLRLQIARRQPGAQVITPSIVHWKLDHFGLVSSESNGRFQVKDPTFGVDGAIGVTAEALDLETDGFALVPEGPLPAGWSPVSVEQAQLVWGKGYVGGHNDAVREPHCMDTTFCCEGGGGTGGGGSAPALHMARASASPEQAYLNISDTPLSYTTPFGAMLFSVTYNQFQPHQPVSYSYSNLGADWFCNWVSYLTIDPTTSVATVRTRKGDAELYTPIPVSGLYPLSVYSQTQLVSMGSGVYERRFPDGTVETFNQSDASSPPRIFLTSIKDPQGNTVLIQYDANFRITTVTDAINQVSTFSYVSNTVGNSGFYKISQIQDPFGRTCSFAYDTNNATLLSITDSIGLQSKFSYDPASSFINKLNTAYGSTAFFQYVAGSSIGFDARGLKFVFPDGTSSVMESWAGLVGETFFWDREATMLYPNDPANKIYTHCKTTKWLVNTVAAGVLEPLVQWEKMPLEGQVTFSYPGQPDARALGTVGNPSQVSRQLGNPNTSLVLTGTKTTGDALSLTFYNSGLPGGQQTVSYTTLAGDTLDSIATALSAAVNGNANLQAVSIQATPLTNKVAFTFGSATTTTMTKSTNVGATEVLSLSIPKQLALFAVGGTPTTGDSTTITVTAYGIYRNATYVTQAGDTISSVAAGVAAAINAETTLQSWGVSATATGTEILVTSNTSEVATYSLSTYPGGATETIALNYLKNPSVQNFNYKYNVLGNVTESVDPVGRKFSYSYDTNNIDLLEARETQGTDNYLLGHWEYNTKHRPTKFIDGSARETDYAYNSSGQLIAVTDANSNVTSLTYTGKQVATIGGVKTAGDILTITVFDGALSGGQKAISRTTLAGDTLNSIASGLAANINADTSLQAIGVSATAASAVVTILSTSNNVTSYSQSTSVGATETISLGTNIFGFLTKINGPMSGNNDITTMSYDSAGRVSQTVDSEGFAVSSAYDNGDRLTQTTYPDGSTEKTVYDRLDATLMKDRIGRWTQRSYDNMHRLVAEIDPLGRKTQYGWCACGSLGVLIDPAGHATSWDHDLQGRVIAKTYEDQTQVKYTYEALAGRLRTRTDAMNQTTTYLYAPDDTPFVVSYTNAVNPTSPVFYTFDPNFKRMTAVQNSWGAYSYTYNNYVTSSTATPITGGGMLSGVSNNVIANSAISYTYDALGRTTNRSINGASNSITWSYDAMSRITAETNALGTFNYAYVDDVSGSSKGTTRLSSINYPNGQSTQFSWFDNIGDQRLMTISNLAPSSAPLSQFSYGYNSAGEITKWGQQSANRTPQISNLQYDLAGQLTSAAAGPSKAPPPFSNQYHYAYDTASNRTSVQTVTTETARLGGSVTVGDTLTLTVNNSRLSGGSQAVSYVTVSGDTLTSAASKLAANVSANSNLQTIGVDAASTGALITVRAAAPEVTTVTQSTSGGATETITLGLGPNAVQNILITGPVTTGNILTIDVRDAALTGGHKSVSYTAAAGNTTTQLATGLKNAVNADASLSAAGITASSNTNTVHISSSSTNLTTYVPSLSAGATETMSASMNLNSAEKILIGGTKTTSDILTLNVYDSGLSGGKRTVSYTITAGDTISTIPANFAAAITADTQLAAIGVTASASGSVVTVDSLSPNVTKLTAGRSASATETIEVGMAPNGVQTMVISGGKTTGDVLTLNVFDAGLTGGSKSIAYTTLAGDTLTSIATNIAAAINADTSLQAIGVTATAVSTVVNITSVSQNATTYSQQKSAGATENIVLGTSSGVQRALHNNVNELVAINGGGDAHFEGSTNKAVKSATIGTQVVVIAAAAPAKTSFSKSVAGGTGSEVVTFSDNYDDTMTATISGTITAGDTVSLVVRNANFLGGVKTASYVVKPGDNASAVAVGLYQAIYNDAEYYNNGIGVSYAGPTMYTFKYSWYPNGNSTAYEKSVKSAATESVALATNTNGNSTATISGTATAGDVTSIVIDNSKLPVGEKVISYTSLGGDSATSIATALKNAINADTSLQSIGLSATSSAGVITLSTSGTTYTTSISGGATETLTLGTTVQGDTVLVVGGQKTTGDVLTVTTANASLSGGQQAVSYTVLAGDDLPAIATGIAAAINANANLQTLGISAAGSVAASLDWSTHFRGNAPLPAGASIASVSGVDGASNSVTNGYQLSVNGGSSSTLTYDLNGNVTSDGPRSFDWDCENRLITITYPGSGNKSVFSYDALSQNVAILEYAGGTITNTSQLVWGNNNRLELRDASSGIIRQYFARGFRSSSQSFYVTRDHLNSVRAVYDSSAVAQSVYWYDPFGNKAALLENIAFDFQYANYFKHQASGLYLSRTRPYHPSLSVWLGTEPLGLVAPYCYVNNNPISLVDVTGLSGTLPCGGPYQARLSGLQHMLNPEGNAATNDQLGRGCVGLTCVLQGAGVGQEGNPENAPNTKCFWSKEEAIKHCCGHNFVFAKQGFLKTGITRATTGPAPNNAISDDFYGLYPYGVYNYVVVLDSGCYATVSHGGSNGVTTVSPDFNDVSIRQFPATIWCSTCK